jgi:hypothetical protein
MHHWSDKNVDWAGIDDAATYIGEFCKRYGRIGGQYKEKYGTVRFYASFCSNLLHLTHPGYCHYGPYSNWLANMDIRYGNTFLKWTGILFFMSKWQPFIYNMAYQRAIRKWPHLRTEILSDADYIEMIKGVWRKEGKKTHILGWKGEIVTTWTQM